MKKCLLIPVLATLIYACNAPLENADLLVFNARVYTVDDNFSSADAFVVRSGKFIAVGSEASLRNRYHAAQEVDAAGKTIVPGFIDAHCHFYGLGQNQEVVNLIGTTSFDEVISRVVAFQDRAQGGFIYGRGWDQNDWKAKGFPDKTVLDSLFPNVPVALQRVDGHALLVNQKALDLAGIDGNTKVAGGAVILKNGMPTGVLVDSPMQLVLAKWPKPDREAQIRGLLAAQRIGFENGLTTVNDAGIDRDVIELIDSLHRTGDLSMRVYAMVSNSPENLDYYLSRSPLKTDRLSVRAIKVYADGALGSRGAALKAPYTDQPGHYGAMITEPKDLEALALRIAQAGYQMNTHAIGDSANIAVLRAYSAALKEIKDPRWKVEHAQILDTADLIHFSAKVLPSVQPTHATSDMYWAQDRLGAGRMDGAYAFLSLLERSGSIALGTDFPVEAVDPIQTFYAAVTRQDQHGYPEGGFLPNQLLSREQALKGMTIWAAYSNFEENEKGSIAPGKWADFIMLSDNLMEAPPEKLKNIEVLQTFIGGHKVY
ncbi:MAG: hypothetical protein RLZZ241_1167 [Bacteroidota bacterium]|jgi:predicted amidohydrolase YtcJ